MFSVYLAFTLHRVELETTGFSQLIGIAHFIVIITVLIASVRMLIFVVARSITFLRLSFLLNVLSTLLFVAKCVDAFTLNKYYYYIKYHYYIRFEAIFTVAAFFWSIIFFHSTKFVKTQIEKQNVTRKNMTYKNMRNEMMRFNYLLSSDRLACRWIRATTLFVVETRRVGEGNLRAGSAMRN